MILIIRLSLKTPTAVERLEYCECGCGKRFPEKEVLKIPTGNDAHPYEYIAKTHLRYWRAHD